MASQSVSIRCIVCGGVVTRDGFKVCWEIKDLNIGTDKEERYFCNINCVEEWIKNLGLTGSEDILNINELEQSV